MQLHMLLSRLACAGGLVALAACSGSNVPAPVPAAKEAVAPSADTQALVGPPHLFFPGGSSTVSPLKSHSSVRE